MSTNMFPCKDCAERTLGCHSLCDKYEQSTIARQQQTKAIKMSKLIGRASFEYQQDIHIKHTKYVRR